MVSGSVEFAASAEAVYDYLVAPANRPQWQSSLRAVDLDGAAAASSVAPSVGLVWHDVTWPGLRPRMELTVADRPRRWTEHGTWRGVAADLTLDFVPRGSGCRVDVTFDLRLPRPWTRLDAALARAALPFVLADLRRAARMFA